MHLDIRVVSDFAVTLEHIDPLTNHDRDCVFAIPNHYKEHP